MEQNHDSPKIDCEKLNCQELNLEGTVYKTLYTKKFAGKGKWLKSDPDKVLAFIPGTISKIFIKPEDVVEPGEDLLILDAMKMQNKLKASRKAKIKAIHVKEGDRVPKGLVMIEFK